MVELLMPDVGDDLEEGTINEWYCEEGDAVVRGQNLLEVMTEKGLTKVPSPASGILNEIFFEDGDDVEVGEVIATIEPD